MPQNRINGLAVVTDLVPAPAPTIREISGGCAWLRRPAGDAPGVARVNGEVYTVILGPDVVRLVKHGDHACYRVANRLAARCDCPDYQHRRAERGHKGCKHVASLRVLLWLLEE